MTSEKRTTQPKRSGHRQGGVADECPSFDTLSAYFDGELPEIEMRSIRAHVANCQNCAPIIADFRSVYGSLNEPANYLLPRSFALTESMAAQTMTTRQVAPITPLSRMARHTRTSPIVPIMTAIAAVLLFAFIAGEAWTNGGNANNEVEGTPRVLMVGGVPVEINDDATYGAASAGSMNGNGSSAEVDTGNKTANTPKSGDSRDWFNWWRPFQLVLGLTVTALIVTMMSRRRPRHD